ncbi:MAG: ABC transporter substrate-binding protein [Roseobacter sp.]
MTRRAHIDRRALFASGAAAALLAATGVCAQNVPLRGGRMRAALSGAQRSDRFDSRQEHGLFMDVAMVGTVFDTLTEIAADGTLRGELATSWQGTEDARTWFFDLRSDVTFHDGAPFTAIDAAASLALHKSTVLTDVEDIKALSDGRLRVVLTERDADFPYRLSDPRLVIYPAGNLAAAISQGIGTGLYRVHKFDPGRQLIAKRVDFHYKDGLGGWFDEIELVALSADAVRAEALRDHYVDVADLTHTADLGDAPGIITLPQEHFMTTAVDQRIAVPFQIGTRWPLDNLRAAERWWMA